MPPEFKFEPYTTFYKPQNAYWLARASQLAYARKAENNPAPDGDFILDELKTWHSGFSEVHLKNPAPCDGMLILICFLKLHLFWKNPFITSFFKLLDY